jgi:hypothetical protein
MRTAIVAVLVAVLVGAAAFFGGTVYGQSRAQQQQGTRRFGAGASGQNGNPANRARRGGIATGTVLAFDGKSVTVKLAAGGSQTAYVSGETTVTRSSDAKLSDLKAGLNVVIVGTPGTAGEITARSIQIVPPGFRESFGGFGGPGVPGAPGGPGGTNGAGQGAPQPGQ